MTKDRLFYTAGEMALMCGIHRNTWAAWVRKGIAPQPVWIGGAHKWLAVDVDKWLARLKRSSSQTLRAAGKE